MPKPVIPSITKFNQITFNSETSTDIPKIIHQIWIGPNQRPEIWMKTFNTDYLEKYPDYMYILWDDQTVIQLLDLYPKCKSLYEMTDFYCGKSDILRYLILYEYGGIYIDADSVWLKNSLTDLISKTVKGGIFAGFDSPDRISITNGVIGCTKKNPYMGGLITDLELQVSTYMRLKQSYGCSKLIGPIFFNRLKDYITIFPSTYFYPVSWHGIKSINQHETMVLPEESYLFQYGYTTNNLLGQI